MKKNIVRIHDIMFNYDSRLVTTKPLFYKGDSTICKLGNEFKIAALSAVSFDTYFNSLSIEKYLKYTNIFPNTVNITLKVKGHFKLELLGCSTRKGYLQKEVISEQEINAKSIENIKMYYSNVSEYTLVAFRITTYSETTFYEGYYEAEIEEVNEVNMAIIAPTFKREKDICLNVNRIKQECLNENSEIKDKLIIHIIDNGQTLDEKEFKSKRVYVHPNINSGGSGGYTRGMIEVLNQNKKGENITHVILMDDDIVINPVVIKNTYYLLRILKNEYNDYCIAGAMLSLQNPNILYELIGNVALSGYHQPAYGNVDVSTLHGILSSEEYNSAFAKRKYAGWWYCVNPICNIKEDNLPLPLFLRGDDVEFAVRNGSKFITLNGVGVWHDSFTYKHNIKIYYLFNRNNLIIEACDTLKGVDYFNITKRDFKKEISRFDYCAAELILRAIEDFIKGPKYIMEEFDEKAFNAMGVVSSSSMSTRDTIYENLSAQHIKEDIPLNRFQRKWYNITYNGHYFPLKVSKGQKYAIMHNVHDTPGKNYLRKELVVVNPYDNTYNIRKIDINKGRELIRRYNKVLRYYDKHLHEIRKSYQVEFENMKNLEFWKSYLKI